MNNDDKEFKSRAKMMGDLIREEEIKMLKLAQAAIKRENEAWEVTKAILARVGRKPESK